MIAIILKFIMIALLKIGGQLIMLFGLNKFFVMQSDLLISRYFKLILSIFASLVICDLNAAQVFNPTQKLI